MKPIKILQIGLGPLGIKIAKMIAERSGIETVAAVDINPKLANHALSTLCDIESSVQIEADLV